MIERLARRSVMSAIRYRYRAGYSYGGYSGKGRRNRERSRAARFDVQRMLDEYTEADEEPRRERYIPIGRCSEFLPSAGVENEELTLHDSTAQAALPFGEPEEVANDHRQDGLIRIRSGDASPRVETQEPRSQEARGSETLTGAVHQEPRGPGRGLDGPQVRSPRPATSAGQERMSVKAGGLVYGCAIGSAAAAAVLMVLRLAVL
jgi:hypothetical protein